MNALACATLVTGDVGAAVDRLERWFDYSTVERGQLDFALAAAWGAPENTGRAMALCCPASGTDIFLRLVEGDPVEDYRPIRTFGWAAIELCVTNVDAVEARIAASPFKVIGPPTPVGGLPTIRPMQVRGPDEETIFLTEILTDDPADGLPRPRSLVDHLFIQVLACRDLDSTARWFVETLGLTIDAPVAIRYSTINKAFDLAPDTRHRIATVRAGGRIVIELDEYPVGTAERSRHDGALPPGVAICTLTVPDLDRLRLDWLTPPARRAGLLYRGRRSGTVRMPEGALLELIDA